MSGLPPAMSPGMPMGPVINPAFLQWQQMQQAWLEEKQSRQQQFEAACELIRGDAGKRFKIDIEADSTVAADEQAEKQARTEFLTAITPFLETVLPQMVANPALAPLGKELVLFAVRGFRVSRQLEDAFETALDNLGKSPPPPSDQTGGKNTKSPVEIQAEAAEAQGKVQVAQQTNAVKLAQMQTEAAIEREKIAAQQQKDAAELAIHGREIEGREALENARIQHMANRDTTGLV